MKTELSEKLYDLTIQYGDEDDYSRDFDYFVETKILFQELFFLDRSMDPATEPLGPL